MNRRHMKRLIISKIIIFLLFSIAASGCGSKVKAIEENYKISIAEQYGLAYAPLQIMKKQMLLEKNLPGIQIEWKQLGNTASIREAMLANEVDAGFMAIPPFLIGWDKGMKWKIAGGLSKSPVALVTNDSNINSIKDFASDDKIALPQPGSVQHILLSMACEKVFNDPHKMDNMLVTMAHPDSVNALLAKKDITAHFSSPPYLYKELESEGIHQILSGEEVMGKDFTFIVGVTTQKLHDNNQKVYEAFVKALNEAIEFVQNNPEETADMLADEYKIEKEELIKYITWEGTEYSSKVEGLNEFIDYMKRNGFISKEPEKIEDILWEDVNYEK